MGTSLYGIMPYGKRLKIVEIFGYSTKGIPGLEIVGLKSLARPIREKFVYLGKTKDVKCPLRRYVLCVESSLDSDKFTEDELRYLEFPLLLLYWSLAGVVQIGNLTDCFASGRIDPNGFLTPYGFSSESLHWLAAKGARSPLRLLAPSELEVPEGLYKLPIEEVMSPLYKLDGECASEFHMSRS